MSTTTRTQTQTKSLYQDKFIAAKFWQDKYEREASKNWDYFYKQHKGNFFNDRQWFYREFKDCFKKPGWRFIDEPMPENIEVDEFDTTTAEQSDSMRGLESDLENLVKSLPEENRVYLELGCGVGNSVFPIIKNDETAIVYCCDYSSNAIEVLRERKRTTLSVQDQARIIEFVCDITKEDLIAFKVPKNGIDVCTCVFVLSALSPETVSKAVENISKTLKRDGRGRCLIRDYAIGDLAEVRFEKARRDGQKLGDHFYVRSDRTRSLFFSIEGLVEEFCAQKNDDNTTTTTNKEAMFKLIECTKFARIIKNRKDETEMRRKWIQASFVRL
jgi:methyltransferase-like protein 6